MARLGEGRKARFRISSWRPPVPFSLPRMGSLLKSLTLIEGLHNGLVKKHLTICRLTKWQVDEMTLHLENHFKFQIFFFFFFHLGLGLNSEKLQNNFISFQH